jgi:hypothetical protein
MLNTASLSHDDLYAATDDVLRETDISTEELFNQADCFSSQLHVLMDAALSDDRCAYK